MTKSTIIYASKDTFISKDSNSINFGKYHNLLLKTDYKILIYFDLSSIPANAIITSAKLNLYLYRFNLEDNATVTIKKLKDTFFENTVTFNTPLASEDLDLENSPIKEISSSNVGQFITFDNLTQTLNSWYSKGSTNHGFELSTTTDYLLSFFSREYTENNMHPHLEIEYKIAEYSLPNIETKVTSQLISQDDNLFVETNTFDISKAILFNYVIENNIIDKDNKCKFAYASVQACDTKYGVFENIGNEIVIAPEATVSIPVSLINKYVRLSINSYRNAPLKVSTIYKSFSNMIAPTLNSAEIIGDTIILNMSNPLAGTVADKSAFVITNNSRRRSQSPNVTSALVSENIVKLIYSSSFDDTSFANDGTFFINYTPSGTNDLTSLNSLEVFDFYKQEITLSTPQLKLDSETIASSLTTFKTTIYDISNLTSFKYFIHLSSSTPTYSATIQLEFLTSRDDKESKLGDLLTITPSTNPLIIPINLKHESKYVRLLVTGDTVDPETNIYISPIASSYPAYTPPTVADGYSYYMPLSIYPIDKGNKIAITMTTPVFGSKDSLNKDIFTITPLSPDIPISISNITISQNLILLTLTNPINDNTALNITYTGTDNDYITSETGDVNNFTKPISTSTDNISVLQEINLLIDGVQTTIYDTSKALKFSYEFANISKNAVATLLECDTRNGDFKPKVDFDKIELIPNEDKTIELPATMDYVCLSISGSNFQETDSLNVTAIYNSFINTIPSKIDYINSIEKGAKILIIMETPVTGSNENLNKSIFTISPPSSGFEITNITILKENITLTLNKPIKENSPLDLIYKGTSTDYIKSKTGDVDNFTKPISIKISPTSTSEEVYTLANGVQTTIYNNSKAIIFDYTISNVLANAVATLYECDTRDGIFKPTKDVDPLPLILNENNIIKVPEKIKYVCLSISESDFKQSNSLTVDATYTTFDNIIPAKLSNPIFKSNNSITLSCRSLTNRPLNPAVFTIISFDNSNSVYHESIVVIFSIYGITIYYATDIAPGANVTITYKGTSTDFLTGKKGDVDNFTINCINQ